MSSTPTLATSAPVSAKGGMINGIDPSAANKGTQAAVRLSAYNIYFGTVMAIDYVTQLMAVSVNKSVVKNCKYITGTLAAYMGVSNVQMPSVGSDVLLIYIPGSPLVIGIAPKEFRNTKWYSGEVCGDVDANLLNDTAGFRVKENDDVMNGATGFAYPRDMAPGEGGFGNDLGPLLSILFNFTKISSGGLALIETHLLNDMVRVVSNYFVHHSCGGDDMIWSAGKCVKESHFTGYPHEAEGKTEEHETFAIEKGDNIYDPVNSCFAGTSNHTGRWRVSQYMGFLGDMIHQWVTDPTDYLSTYNADARRAGKFRNWVGADGTYMVQSIAGIHMEVQPKVVIPTVHTNWNDPDFDANEAMKRLDGSFLKIWGKGPDWKDLKVAVWQMRNYTKYIVLWHSLERWKQMENSGYCTIPTEEEAKDPEMTCKEKDKEEVNPSAKKPADEYYASISILPDGSIAIMTGQTASIVLNQGNIQINAPNNIEINAGGTIALTGKRISAKALEHIEINSLAGSLYLKARSAFQALCEKGRLWLKSDAKANDTDDGIWPADGGDPIPHEMAECGIVLDASQSRALLSGDKGVIVSAAGEDSEVNVQALNGQGSVNILGTNIKLVSRLKVIVNTIKWAVSAVWAKIASTDIKLGDNVRVNAGGITTDMNMKAQSIMTTGPHVSNASQYNVVPEESVPLEVESSADEIGDEAKETNEKELTFDVNNLELGLYDWKLPFWYVGTDVIRPDSIKAGMTIDRYNIEHEWDDHSFFQVMWPKCKLEAAPRTNPTYQSWPGNNARFFEFSDHSIPPLGKGMGSQFSEGDIKTLGDLSLKPYRFLVQQL